MSSWTCRVSFRDFSLHSISKTSHVSDQQIGTLLYRDIQYAFFDFIDSILKDCQQNPAIGRIPILWNKPIYGDQAPNFTDFAAPGVQLT